MDRIRKALDLARQDRARFFFDAEEGVRRLSAEPTLVPVNIPVSKPVAVAKPVTELGVPSSTKSAELAKPLPDLVTAPAPVAEPAEAASTKVSLESAAGRPDVAPPRSGSDNLLFDALAAVIPRPIRAAKTPNRETVPAAEHRPVKSSAPTGVPEAKAPSASVVALPIQSSAARPGSGVNPSATPATVIELRAPEQIAPQGPGEAPIPEKIALRADAAERERTHPKSVALTPAPRAFNGVIEYTKTRSYTPPKDLLRAKRIVDPTRVDAAATAFRMLRTQVLQRMEERGWRSLAVLSPNSEDGKTTTAANLAVSLAYDHRHTVLLVDCDLKHPGIAEAFGITPEFGLDDLLMARAQVEQCLYHPEGFDRLVILPARAALANSSEALSSTRARDLVAELKARYPERIIVFDLPPILGTDDALAFLPMADCALMVAAERSTKREDLLRSMELVTKIPIVGTVLNRSTAVPRPYG